MSTTYSAFNFADARCPPASISGLGYWTVLGGEGESYNPVISPPAGLTLIDPAWNQLCTAAPFQGYDPPYALVPESNLGPDPTPAGPVATTAPASPNSGIPPVAVETSRQRSSGWVLSTQTAMVQQPSGAPAAPGSAKIFPSPKTHPTQASNDPASSISPGDPPSVDPNNPSASKNAIVTTGAIAASGHILDPPLRNTATTDIPAQITVAGQTYTANSASAFLINSQTLPPGAIVTIAGTPITLPSLPQPTPPPEALTFADHTNTANAAAAFVIDGKTLAPNGIITVSGTPISLVVAASLTEFVVGTSTEVLGSYILQGLGGPGGSGGGNGSASSAVPFRGEGRRLGVGGGWSRGMGMLMGVGVGWLGGGLGGMW